MNDIPATRPSTGARRQLAAVLATILALALGATLAIPAVGARGAPADRPGTPDRPQGCELLPDPAWCDQDPADWPLPEDTTPEERAVLGCTVDPARCRDDIVIPDLPDAEDPAAAIVECITDIPGCTVEDGAVATCLALTPECLGEDAYRDLVCADDPEACDGDDPPTTVTVPPQEPRSFECDAEEGGPVVRRFGTRIDNTTVTAIFDVVDGDAPLSYAKLDWGTPNPSQWIQVTRPERLSSRRGISHTYRADVSRTYTLTLTAYDSEGRCTTATTEREVDPLYRAELVIESFRGTRCDTLSSTEMRLGWSWMDRGRHRSDHRRWSYDVISSRGIAVDETITFKQVTLDELDDIGVELFIDDEDSSITDFLNKLGAAFDPSNWDFDSSVRFGPEAGQFTWRDHTTGERTHTATLRDGSCTARVDVTHRLVLDARY